MIANEQLPGKSRYIETEKILRALEKPVVSELGASGTRAAGKLIVGLGKRIATKVRLEWLRETTRPLMPLALVVPALGELTEAELEGLAVYLESPDFEYVALQLLFAQGGTEDWRAELRGSVREEIRHGLRHMTGISDGRLVALTDLAYDALTVACQERSGHGREDPFHATAFSVSAHMATAAARNGQLLARIPILRDCHSQATRLREQIQLMHNQIRLPHTGTGRAAPWDALYVPPTLTPAGRDEALDTIQWLTLAGHRTVLLGDPGAGKSTLAAKLTYDIASQPDGDRVPFLIVLRDLNQALLDARRRLVDHLIAVASEPYNVELSADVVEYLLLNGRAVVILDGLDELIDPHLRRRIVQLVEGFATLYPQVPLVVTARRIGYFETSLRHDLFATCVLAKFDEDQVATYVTNWFALDESHPASERERLQSSFMRESSSIADLRRNALLLSLLCGMYSTEQYIPRNRSDVYERCALMLFDKWNAMRGMRAPLPFEGQVRGAVQQIAWTLFTQDQGTELPRRKILDVLAEYLRRKSYDEDEARGIANDFLDFCAGRAWVLSEVGTSGVEPVYGFSHRTFLEYFAAEHLVRHHPTPTGVLEVLLPQISEGGWDVVGQLSVQLLDRNRDDGAEQFLSLVLDEAESLPMPYSRALTAFAVRASSYVSFTPPLAKRISEAALAFAMAPSLDDRFKLAHTESELALIEALDEPLNALINECLDVNLRPVTRALEESFGRFASEGSALGLCLLVDMHRYFNGPDKRRSNYWRVVQSDLSRRFSGEIQTWRHKNPGHARAL